MAFRGSIPKGSQVTVELQVANTAKGTALLAIAFADNGGGAGSDSKTAARGGTARCRVQTNAGATGLLRLLVDFNHDADTGQLIVLVNGNPHDSETITGDTPWSYALS